MEGRVANGSLWLALKGGQWESMAGVEGVYLHLVFLAGVCAEQVGCGLHVIGQLRLSQLCAE